MMSARIGSWTVYRYDTVDSTQRVAVDLIAAGAAHRTAVVANRQTAGYGRKGDAWHDAPGLSLLVTLILKPAEPRHLPRLAMIAALAVIDAIAEVGGACAVIKWPNDVLINDRKVAGVLGDATWRGPHLDAVRLGIGINVGGDRAFYARRSLPGATSISAEMGRAVDRDAVLVALLNHVATRQDRLDRGGVEEIVAAWRHALTTIGRAVVVTRHDGREVRGIAEQVTDDGDLIVVTETAMRVQITATEARSLRHVAREAEKNGGGGL
jgi:BirA family biotin operon repressor/biotin-[acetyl-CoA-carboxylase] ligase